MLEQTIKIRRKVARPQSTESSNLLFDPLFVSSLHTKSAAELVQLTTSFTAYLNKVNLLGNKDQRD